MKELLIKPEILKKLLFSSLMLLSGAAMAETVSPEQALGKALSFFQQPVHTRGQQAAQSLTLAHTAQADGETYYYVFNNPAGGYVIVGGDDVAHDVLAYSESGSFDPDQLSPATRWWLGQYQSQIHQAVAAERQGVSTRSAATRAEEWPEVKPLLGGIEWGQEPPYNAFVLDNGQIEDAQQQYPIGCVTTATAQVMRYWKYPERGMFSHAYRSKGIQVEAKFSESVYQWDLMQEKYLPIYSGTPEEKAVAQLMSDVSIALNTTYERKYAGGSGTVNEAIPYALRTYFGYSKEMELLNRDQLAGMPAGMWEQIIYGELAKGRPVLYGGVNPNGSNHCFVCDGYKDGFFHINWGWEGRANQEYCLLTSTETIPALEPKDKDLGNIYGQYNANQVIITGIQPDPQSEGFVYLSEPMSVPAEAPVGPLHLEGKLSNPTSHDVKAAVSVHMQDIQGIYIHQDEMIDAGSEIVIPAKQEVPFSFDIPEEKLIPGVTYSCLFEILDISNPEIPMEAYQAMSPWLFCAERTHIEGPEHVLLNMAAGFSSLCIPFDASLPDGVKAYTAESISADNKVVMKQAASIEAGKCYLLRSEPIEQPILLTGIKTTDEIWSVGPVFKGNLTSEYQFFNGASYGIIPLNGAPALQKDELPSGIPGHKIIVDGSMSDAEFLYFNFDETSGIQQLHHDNKPAVRYNLLGQPAKDNGLVIRDGQVVFEK